MMAYFTDTYMRHQASMDFKLQLHLFHHVFNQDNMNFSVGLANRE